MSSQYEFSHAIKVDDVPLGGLARHLKAIAGECAALAERFGLLALHRLEADIEISPAAGASLLISGRLEAEVEQACVVTLEPVPAKVVSEFAVRYISGGFGGELGEDGEITLDFGEEDIEPLEGDMVDAGEIVAQYLALALDPYPRKPGVAITAHRIPEVEEKKEPTRPNPFEVLKNLKEKG